jgi:hypothetical protein
VSTGAFTINNAASTYSGSGNVTVAAGNLLISNGSATPTGSVTVTAGNVSISAGAHSFGDAVTVSAGNLGVSGGSLSCNPAAARVVAANSLTLNGGTMTTNNNVTLNVTNNFTVSNAASSFTGGTGVTTISAGSLLISNGSATFGGAVTLTAGQIQISGGSTTFNAAAITSSAANGDCTISAGTLTNNATMTLGRDLVMSAAGGTLTGAGDIHIGRHVSLTAGTFNGNARTIYVAGNWTENVAIFSAGTSTVEFLGSTGTAAVNATNPFATFSVNSAANTVTAGSSITVNNALIVLTGTLNGPAATMQIAVIGDSTSTGAIHLQGGNYITNNLIVNGSFVGSGAETVTVNGSVTVNGGGIISLTGAGETVNVIGDTTYSGTINTQGGSYSTRDLTANAGGSLVASASEIITVNRNIDLSALGVNYTFATSTIQMAGAAAATINVPSGNDSFYELEIKKGALGNTVTLISDITILHSVTITSGTLRAGARMITMQGVIWDNEGSKTGIGAFNPGTGSVFFTPSAPVLIKGNNDWYNFTCTTDGTTIQFEHGWTQTILFGGNFNVYASSASNRIVLTTDNTMGGATNPGYPPTPPHYTGQWIITNLSVLAQIIDNVDVSYSFATISITPGPGALDSGHNDNWNFVIPIVASWTLDTDNNGRIDRIRAQVRPGTQLSENFSGFVATVDSYTVTGYLAIGANIDVFDITLAEGAREDTTATPRWRVLANPGNLYGLVGGALVDHDPSKSYIAASGARPVITYTLAAVGSTKAYVHFSALVYGDASGAPLVGAGSLAYSGSATNPIVSVTPVEMVGNGAHAVVVTFTNPLSATDIFPGPAQTINAVTGKIWGQPYPSQFIYPSSGGANTTTYPGDPGVAPYTSTTTDGFLPAGGTAMLNPSTTPAAVAHNISDVGMNFVIPVFALDLELIRDPAKGGLGLITTFDGSKWLPPQNTMIEARVMVPALSAASVKLFWDTNPPALSVFNNLWIPTSATTMWPTAAGGDRVHYPGYDGLVGALSPSSINGPLRDFLIPASNPAIKDGATVQFLFVLDDGAGHLLPSAFPADPNDPSAVRPFAYALHSIIQQRGEVTITNNVINPASGQVAYLDYVMANPGAVTITVFNLNGDIVNVLARGTQAAGEYTTSWDGKNRGGRIVARGIYFIRVVGPGFDEMRKVLVVR